MGDAHTLRLVPDWVIPDHRQVIDFHWMAHKMGHDAGWVNARGQATAVDWATGGRRAPVTRRGDRASRALVRAESWVALCRAANDSEPTPADWDHLGVPYSRSREADRDFAHGAWRALAWLLGVRPDPPLDVPLRAEDGSVPPGSETYTMRARPGDPLWENVQHVYRERNTADAVLWFNHVRTRVATTYGQPASSQDRRG
jgi:hypothetical protein